MNKTAIVTGAGSGVGRAVSLALARKGWRVALVGRRRLALEETVELAVEFAVEMLVCPCDISNATAVGRMGRMVLRHFKSVEVLVNAAGTNTPKRSLKELSLADYERLMGTNLHGAYLCAQAFLPAMRAQGSGTIVNIVSDAAKQANAKAGPAYVMSKFGLVGFTQAINLEDRSAGIRACAVFPGDIDTALLGLRPSPPTPEARAKMLQPEDVAACVLLAIELPAHAIVEEIMVRPR